MDKYKKEIIAERIDKLFNKVALLEYLIDRKQYKRSIVGDIKQIIMHWCCLRYFRYLGGTIDDNHWRIEIMKFMVNVMDNELKGKQDDNSKKKVINEVFNECNLYDSNNIYKLAFNKLFIDERIPKKNINKDILVSASNDFIRDIDKIMNFLHSYSDASLEMMEEYVMTL